MKPILAAFLSMCLLLTACTQTPAETTPPTSQETTLESTVATTPETTVFQTYQHPLNGEVLESPWIGHATAVVLNNIRQSLPHHGISGADLVYELETEGGITRMLAIFSSLEGVGSIGPVRSARSFFNSIATSYGAPVVHCGGSKEGLSGHYADNGEKIENWTHIDENQNYQYFFRDQARLNAGYGAEHTLFTSGQKLQQALSDLALDAPNSQETDYGLSFGETAITGAAANTVTVTFTGGKTTTMEYNEETGRYDFYQYGSQQTDGNTGSTVDFSNVLMLSTKQWFKQSGSYVRSFYTLVGSGSGYCAMGGQIVPIRWYRDALNGPFTFTLEDGTPLELTPGSTYVAFSGLTDYISYS